MKIASSILLLLLLAVSQIASAQTQVTIADALNYWIANCETEVVAAADAMPNEKYSYAPVAGEFTGVRTFAQQVKHLAANNYRMANRILAQSSTPDQEAETGPSDVRSKEQIMNYLKGSFSALHRATESITVENALAPVMPAQINSEKQSTRVQFAVDAVAHSYDHYGQMVEYLRMNGIVPPASRK